MSGNRLDRRLARLEDSAISAADDDPRLTWLLWPGPERVTVLALVDFCAAYGSLFASIGGPSNAPGFNALPVDARTLLVNQWALWGSSRRFARIVASFVSEPAEFVQPLWYLRSTVRHAQLRRRFQAWYPDLLARFASEGDPVYTSHRTFRAENWPARATWTVEERGYIGTRFFHWSQKRAERAGEHCVRYPMGAP